MSGLEERLSRLSPEKRALLERTLMQRRAGAAGAASDAILPRGDDGPCVLSFSQQRLWFLDQLAPGEPTYNAVLAMRVRGPLDVDRLRRGLLRIIERHEALRTVFEAPDGEPRQVVLRHWAFDVPVVDLRHVPEERREAEMRRLGAEHARRPYDLSRDLMLRVLVLRLTDDEQVVLFLEHHIAFDGWSDGQLFRELEECYRAELEGREPRLDPLPVQYADFSAWQRARMQGALLERHVDYWRTQLAGAPAHLELPTDLPRPPVQRFDGVHLDLELDPALGDAVRALARGEAATPFMVLLAAFAALLARWTGQDDVVLGSPVANRGRVELEHLIGFFSNTFALRVKADGDPTFRELVRRARETALGAYEHQDLPFEKVVEAIRPPRDPSRNPIFQVNFRVQTATRPALELPGMEIEPFDLDIGFSRFDLALELQLEDERFGGYVEYNSALFEEATAQWLAAQLAALLTDALERPDVPIGELAFEPRVRVGSIRGARRRR